HLVLRRQVVDDRGIALQATQQERPDDALQSRRGWLVAVALDRHRVVASERFKWTEQARVQELENRPQLRETILDGCAGQREPMRGAQRAGAFRRRGR